jgi:hypothetical protein
VILESLNLVIVNLEGLSSLNVGERNINNEALTPLDVCGAKGFVGTGIKDDVMS